MALRLFSSSVFVVFALFFLSGCGEKNGGVRESGLERDGSCSAQLVRDITDFGAAKTTSEIRLVCVKYLNKWGTAPIKCSRKEDKGSITVNTTGLKDYCDERQ